MAVTIRGLLLLAVLWVPQSVQSQQVRIDTTTAMYQEAGLPLIVPIAGRLQRWAKALDLDRWQITLRLDSLPEHVVGQTQAAEAYRIVIIVLDLRGAEPERLDEILVHELWHIKLAPYTTYAKTMAHVNDDNLLLWVLQQREESLVTELTRWTLLTLKP